MLRSVVIDPWFVPSFDLLVPSIKEEMMKLRWKHHILVIAYELKIIALLNFEIPRNRRKLFLR